MNDIESITKAETETAEPQPARDIGFVLWGEPSADFVGVKRRYNPTRAVLDYEESLRKAALTEAVKVGWSTGVRRHLGLVVKVSASSPKALNNIVGSVLIACKGPVFQAVEQVRAQRCTFVRVDENPRIEVSFEELTGGS